MLKHMRALTCTNPFSWGLREWAEAPHQGLARSQFRAFYHPPESPLLLIRVLFRDRIDLLAPPEGVFDRPACITARPHRHARAHRHPAIFYFSIALESVLSIKMVAKI